MSNEMWTEDKEFRKDNDGILMDTVTSFVTPRYFSMCNFSRDFEDEFKNFQRIFRRRKRDLNSVTEVPNSKDLSTFYLDTIHNIAPQKVRELQSETMQKYMNNEVDPCTDFYSYACGNWGKYNPIPEDKVGFDTFEILRESLDVALRGVLENLNERNHEALTAEEVSYLKKIKNKNRRRRKRRNFLKTRRSLLNDPEDAVIKAKNLYNSCMNYDLIRERGIEPLLEILKKLGGWPLLDPDWDEEKFDWLTLVANLRKYNNDILIGQWIGPDIQQSEVNIIQFDQTTLGLPSRDYFLASNNQDALKSYQEFMINILKIMGVEDPLNEAEKMIDFETNLAKIVSAPEDRLNISLIYKKMSIEQLHVSIPQIDWTKYLEIVQERKIDPKEKVIMYAFYYMHDLVDLISETEPATVANYLFWRFVRHRVNNLDDRFLEAKQKFYRDLFGREKRPPRWKSCVTQGSILLLLNIRLKFQIEVERKDSDDWILIKMNSLL
jgi:predicted metalloendopeptidase